MFAQFCDMKARNTLAIAPVSHRPDGHGAKTAAYAEIAHSVMKSSFLVVELGNRDQNPCSFSKHGDIVGPIRRVDRLCALSLEYRDLSFEGLYLPSKHRFPFVRVALNFLKCRKGQVAAFRIEQRMIAIALRQ